MSYSLRLVQPDDTFLLEQLLTVFGDAFGDRSAYTIDQTYLRELLGSNNFIALVAITDSQVVGGLTAYELPKCEQNCSEIYIYDLAVAVAHRRQGIATGLIQKIQTIARSRGVGTIFVQADREDLPAIKLYSKFGKRQEVLHFDIPVGTKNCA